MTPLAWQLLGAAAVAAVVDWWAVAGARLRVEYLAKPLVLILLLGAAIASAGDPAARPWLLLALAASLVGDVFLLPSGIFPLGLLAFLVAQLAYLGAFVNRPGEAWLLAAGVLVALALGVGVGRPMVRGAPPTLRPPIAAYLVVICLMAIAATRTGLLSAVTGAWLFVASDTILGWDRFVAAPPKRGRPAAIRRLAVMVPYHLGQGMLLLALAG